MSSYPLVSLQDLLAAMPVAAGNSSYSERLLSLARLATTQLETATNRRFARQTHTQYLRTLLTGSYVYDFYGSGEDGVYPQVRPVRYVLRGTPVQGALDVRYDPYRAFGTETVVDPAAYLFDVETGVLSLRLATTAGEGYLRVVYEAGYEVDTTDDPDNPYLTGVPEDLKVACLSQVQFLFNKLSPDNVGVSVERGAKAVPAAYFSRNGGLTPEVAAMVAHYRQPLVGLA